MNEYGSDLEGDSSQSNPNPISYRTCFGRVIKKPMLYGDWITDSE